MTKFAYYVLIILLLAANLQAQIAPQYNLAVNFLGSGVYDKTAALNTVFDYQFSTNLELEADLLSATGGGVNDYEGGVNYDLCGIKLFESALALSSLNCGSLDPFVAFTAGEGRVEKNKYTTLEGPAFMAKVGVSIKSSTGTVTIPFIGGYGYFGPEIKGQQNKGFYFYTGITFGVGNNAAASQARQARLRRAYARKLKRLQAKAKKAEQS